MAAAQALSVPELLLNIFQPLQDETYRHRTLASALRVNSTWFEFATDVLWGSQEWMSSPRPQDLHNVSEDRRQVYAYKMRALLFCGWGFEPDYHTIFRGLHFPRLRVLVVDHVGQEDGPPLFAATQYLYPMLESIRLWKGNGAFANGMLNALNDICPRLRKVMFADLDLVSEISAKDFLRFFRGRDLVEIEINEDPSLISVPLMVGLSQKKGLARLGIRNRLATAQLKRIAGKQTFVSIQTAGNTFQDVRELRLDLDTEAILYVPLAFSNLTKAELAIKGDKYAVFQYLGLNRKQKEFDPCKMFTSGDERQ